MAMVGSSTATCCRSTGGCASCLTIFDRKDAYAASTPTVYDWIDDLSVFPYDRAFLASTHERALQEATVVTSVARRLHEQARRTRPDAVYLPNGVDYKHFAVPGTAP